MKKIFPCFLILSLLSIGPVLGAEPGDVNDDGFIDLEDAVLVIRLLSGDAAVDVAIEADVNQDVGIGMQEAIYALQRIACIRPMHTRNQFNIGDSIGEGEAADDDIGVAHHETVWSTGYTQDITYSINERFEDIDPDCYNENNGLWDGTYNKAVSGDTMADFYEQAIQVVAEADAVGGAGLITIFLGNNDVCADSLDAMTDLEQFEHDYTEGLEILAGAESTKNAEIHVYGIPSIYWLWIAKKSSWWCRTVWAGGDICLALLLDSNNDDCESIASRDNPDNNYPSDGPNCLRRKIFHRRIRDDYNTKLRDVLQGYINTGRLPNACYIDIFDIKFEGSHINSGDCFHPSYAGHKLLAEEAWCRSPWSDDDIPCDH
jgi:lysophospholipase L1-like esterase